MATRTPESDASTNPAVAAPTVLRIVWADPQHMAEHVSAWSLAHFGPRAEAAVAREQARRPDAGRNELERRVIARQARVAMTEGAFVGGPFILLVAVAFCASLLAQAQMVYELAVVAGHDASDERRAAELLVLLGAYPSVVDAAAGLAAMTRDPATRGKRLPLGTRWDTVKRMGYLLEVFGSGDERSRLRATLGWAGVSLLFVVGLVLPLVWVPYMAYSSRRFALRLGARARDFYRDPEAEEAGASAGGDVLQAGGAAAFLRAALYVVIPVGAAVLALITGFPFGGRLLNAVLILLVLSAVTTGLWLGLRWFRARRAGGSPASSTGSNLRGGMDA